MTSIEGPHGAEGSEGGEAQRCECEQIGAEGLVDERAQCRVGAAGLVRVVGDSSPPEQAADQDDG